jgi:hypothetical protein
MHHLPVKVSQQWRRKPAARPRGGSAQPVGSGAGASVTVRRPPGIARVHVPPLFTACGLLPSSSPTSASALSRDAGVSTALVAGDPSVDVVLHAHDVERLDGAAVALAATRGGGLSRHRRTPRARARERA